MEDITNVAAFEDLAKHKLPKMAYDYYASGAEDEYTLKLNRSAFEQYSLKPRVLVDVSEQDLSTTVLGHRISMPVMIAPTAMHRLAHPDGEVATARAAASMKTAMVLSVHSTASMEEVASVGPGVRFFQLYVYKNRHVAEQLVRRAEQAGYTAIVLTVDAPRLGRREADIKNKFEMPPGVTLGNFRDLELGDLDQASANSGLASLYLASQFDPSLQWKDVRWLQSITSIPILIKGVMSAADAELAVLYGAQGIIVSNHGARQLDYTAATIQALEEVVLAAQGKVPVFVDGGIRRGTDVLKALALGAKAVFIGRPVLFGLACDGEAGVTKVLIIIKDELELAMALVGCPSLETICRAIIVTPEDRLRGMLRNATHARL